MILLNKNNKVYAVYFREDNYRIIQDNYDLSDMENMSIWKVEGKYPFVCACKQYDKYSNDRIKFSGVLSADLPLSPKNIKSVLCDKLHQADPNHPGILIIQNNNIYEIKDQYYVNRTGTNYQDECYGSLLIINSFIKTYDGGPINDFVIKMNNCNKEIFGTTLLPALVVDCSTMDKYILEK